MQVFPGIDEASIVMHTEKKWGLLHKEVTKRQIFAIAKQRKKSYHNDIHQWDLIVFLAQIPF